MSIKKSGYKMSMTEWIKRGANESKPIGDVIVTVYSDDDEYVFICSAVDLFEKSFKTRQSAIDWILSDQGKIICNEVLK